MRGGILLVDPCALRDAHVASNLQAVDDLRDVRLWHLAELTATLTRSALGGEADIPGPRFGVGS